MLIKRPRRVLPSRLVSGLGYCCLCHLVKRMPWKQSDAISLKVVGLAVAVALNAQSVNHFAWEAMLLWPDLDKLRIDARNPRTGLYCDSASNAVDCECRSCLRAADFHLQSSPVSGLRQRGCRRVYINRPAKQRSTGLPKKIPKFFLKDAFRQRKHREKRLRFFWLGG